MSVDRGYKGDKAGQGYGRTLPKRAQCPCCDKKGVFRPDRSRWPSSAEFAWEYRECQFCRMSWASGLSWVSSCEAAERRRMIAAAAKPSGEDKTDA